MNTRSGYIEIKPQPYVKGVRLLISVVYFESLESCDAESTGTESEIASMSEVATEIEDEQCEEDDEMEPQKPPLRYCEALGHWSTLSLSFLM